MRRRCNRRVWAFTSLCASSLLVFWYCYSHYGDLITSIQCNNDEYERYLRELCQMYTDGLVTGSMCGPLCEKAEISYRDCLSRRDSLYVMSATWNGTLVVLKAKAVQSLASHDEKPYEGDDSIQQLEAIVEQKFLGRDPTEVMRFLLSECLVEGDNFTSHRYCWHLGTHREFVLLAALQDSTAMPRLLGVCGNLYAVEYAPSDAFTSHALFVREVRGWNFRAKLGIAFIEMAQSLEQTKYGTLYLCDVMESNFGVVHDDGKYIIRAIDNGESYFNQTVSTALQDYYRHDCTTHSDCHHLGCSLQCNFSSKKCMHKITSTNLQVVCRKLLHKGKQERNMPRQGLLDNPPTRVQKELAQLLNECVHPQQTSAHYQLRLANRIKHTLAKTLHSPRHDKTTRKMA